MGLLHSERWPELGPEFDAAELLDSAIKVLTVDDAPSSSAIALQHAKAARATLHPCTRDPAAREEYAQRKAGAFGESARVKREGDARDQTIAALNARLALLENKGEKPEGKGAK
jgi:hypothetical protein